MIITDAHIRIRQIVVISGEESLSRIGKAAYLLGVEAEDLARVLTTRIIEVEGTVSRAIVAVVV